MSTTVLKAFELRFSVGLMKFPAALLIKISIFLKRPIALFAIFSTCSGSLTSQGIGSTSTPFDFNSSDVSWITSFLLLVMTRLAPNSANRFAMDLPKPVPPPVITMVFPLNRSVLNMFNFNSYTNKKPLKMRGFLNINR